MKRYIPIFLAAFALAGCHSAATVDLTGAQKSVYAAKTAYASVLTVAVAYNERPRCGAPTSPALCSSADAVVQIRKADAAASAAIDSAESAVRTLGANPSALQAAVTAAQDAVTAYQSIATVYQK